MSQKHIESVFKDIHKTELERRDRLSSKITRPVSISILVGGVVSHYLTIFPFNAEFDFYQLFFLITICLLSAFLILTLGFAFFSFYNFKTQEICDPSELKKWIEKSEKHYREKERKDDSQITESVENDLREYLVEQYLECSTINRKSNDKKALRLHYADTTMLIMLLVLAISVLPYIMTKSKIENVSKVEIKKEQKHE